PEHSGPRSARARRFRTEPRESPMAVSTDSKAPKVSSRKRELEVDKLFAALVKLEGSDLHLKVDVPPHVRVKGSLRPLSRGPIDDDEMERLLLPMLNERNRKIFDETGG